MIIFKTDLEKNILYASFIGVTTKEKASEAILSLTEHTKKMYSDFTIISDMSLMKGFHENELEKLCILTNLK